MPSTGAEILKSHSTRTRPCLQLYTGPGRHKLLLFHRVLTCPYGAPGPSIGSSITSDSPQRTHSFYSLLETPFSRSYRTAVGLLTSYQTKSSHFVGLPQVYTLLPLPLLPLSLGPQDSCAVVLWVSFYVSLCAQSLWKSWQSGL